MTCNPVVVLAVNWKDDTKIKQIFTNGENCSNSSSYWEATSESLVYRFHPICLAQPFVFSAFSHMGPDGTVWWKQRLKTSSAATHWTDLCAGRCISEGVFASIGSDWQRSRLGCAKGFAPNPFLLQPKSSIHGFGSMTRLSLSLFFVLFTCQSKYVSLETDSVWTATQNAAKGLKKWK